jgi:hypothetical protein
MELKTFGQVEQTLEKFEQVQPTVETVAEPVQTNNPNPIEATAPQEETTVVPDATPENVEVKSGESTFSLGGDVEINTNHAESTPPNTPTAAPFNLDEELKKVDRTEVLKKLGVTDFALEMDEYLAKGGKAADYLSAKAIDYNLVSDEDIVKQDLQKQYPTFTPQQINLMFNRKYGVHEDAEQEDRDFAELQLKADAHNSRQTKIAEQQKFKIPDAPILQKDEAYEQWKESMQSQSQLMEQVRGYYEQHEATKTLNESKRVTINLGAGVPPFNFLLDQPQMLTKALTDGGETINKLMTTKSGEPDVAKQQLVTLFSFAPEKFIQDIFKYGQSMGVRKELVEEGQNAQRPQAKIADMGNGLKPTVVGTGTYGARSRE